MEAFQMFFKTCVFVQHQGLVTILEDGQILELNEEFGYLILVNEETCEQHERNNQHWCQGNSQLFVTEDSTKDQSVSTGGIIDQEQDTNYKYENKVRLKIKLNTYGRLGICTNRGC